jgi:putative transposase
MMQLEGFQASHACDIARVSRAGFYRHYEEHEPRQADVALVDRHIEPGIVHHSDRGVQYCCHAYVEKLQAHGFAISLSRTGNPYDNAKAEAFMKTLKSEEVYLHQYRDQEEARVSIQCFIEEVYNRKRLHSALGYLPPDAFEQRTPDPDVCGGPAQ